MTTPTTPLFASLFLSAGLLLSSGTAIAQSAPGSAPIIEKPVAAEKENSINVSPLGLLLGSYHLNYERLIGGYHGFLVEADFANFSDDDSSSKSFGGSVGYCYHWSGEQDSGFVGVNAGHQRGTGEATLNTGSMKTFDVDTSVTHLTANVGRRWAWNSGFNITLRIGAGWGNYNITTDSQDPEAQEAVELVDDLLTLLPVAVDGELSIGYAF